MAQVKLDLGTKVKHSYKGALLNEYFSLFDRQVSVPVSIQTSMFVFDFKQTAERALGEKISDEKLRRMITTLAAAIDRLDDNSIRKIFEDLGYTVEGEDNSMVADLAKAIRNHVTNSIARSGISPILFKDVFTSSNKILAFEDFRSLSLAEITDAIRHVQVLYGKFTRSEPVAEIASYMRESLFSNKVMEMARLLLKTISYESTARVQSRLSYVLDESFKSIYGAPYVSTSPVFTGKVYEIDKIEMPELSFGEMLGGVIVGIRTLSGMPWSQDSVQIDLKDVVVQLTTGIGKAVPFVPDDVGDIDLNRVATFMERMTLKHIITRILTNDFGSFERRVMSVITERKYLRDDSFDDIIREGLTCASIVFDAFLDTGASMKFFTTSDDIYFNGIHPIRQREVRDFVYKYLGDFKNFSMPMTHASFYNEPAHLINHTISYAFTLPEFVIKDEDRTRAKTFVLAAEEETFMKVFRTKIESGDIWDFPNTPLSRRLLNLADLVEPVYRLSFPVTNDILRSDAVRYAFGILPVSEVKKKTSYSKDLISRGTVRMFKTAMEMSMQMRLPLELAEQLFSKYKDEFYLDLTADASLTFYFDPALFKIREVAEFGDAARLIRPFVMTYPGYVKDVDASYPLSAAPVTLEDTTKNPPVTKKADKKKEEEKKEETGDKTEGDEGTEDKTE